MKNLQLYHGSSTQERFTSFFDGQFYTVNEYIAESYAENFGGSVYTVQVQGLVALELVDYDVNINKDKHDAMVALLRSIYGEDVAENYSKRCFWPSPSATFGEKGWQPIIDWAKLNGYNAIIFIDESFDTFVRDTTYLIFDGTLPKIIDVR